MTEKQKLLKMEKTLRKEVVGQDEAVAAVANAIRLNRSGLSNQDRPIASFLFVGPSGTGKTQLAKALAKFLFDSPDAMLRIDGSEYVCSSLCLQASSRVCVLTLTAPHYPQSEKHSISRLIGAPPGYVGFEDSAQLTEYIRRKPYSVVLIDE